MPREANAVDFWRGIALITIFINHVPGIYYARFTHANYSFSDSADLFVFLAGWSLRYIVGSPNRPQQPTGYLVLRLGGRAVELYAAQILITMIAIAMLAASATILDNPLLLEWHNAAAVFYDPILTHIGLAALTHHLGYFDILPLYVVLMAVAPVFAIIDRYAPNWLLPLSVAIYLVALIVPLPIPTWPVEGQWFFNPLAWQLVFVLGFVLAREDGAGGFVRRHIVLLRWLSRADRRSQRLYRMEADVARSDADAAAAAPVHRRQDLCDTDAADPVSGAGRFVFSDLSLYQALGASASSSSARCSGATR